MEHIVLTSWDSKAELFAYLQQRVGRRTLVGADSEAPRKFYSLSIGADDGAFEVGVISSGFGTAPALGGETATNGCFCTSEFGRDYS